MELNEYQYLQESAVVGHHGRYDLVPLVSLHVDGGLDVVPTDTTNRKCQRTMCTQRELSLMTRNPLVSLIGMDIAYYCYSGLWYTVV